MKKRIPLIIMIILLIFSSFSLHAQTTPRYGDVNNDGSIDIVDALMTAQYYVGLIMTFAFPEAADVDGNGTINIVDALMIAQYYVGLISEFPVQQTLAGMEVVKSDLKRNPEPQPAAGELEAVVDGNNQFAFDCYREIKGQDGNLFFSPVSISFAFAMCYAGANGNTEAQIADTMHFTLPEDTLHNAFNSLDLVLTSEPANPNPDAGEDLKLHIANSTWGQMNYYFVPDFLDVLAYHYGAGMNTVDFKSNPENCRLLINDWVSDNTEQRINDLLPPGSIGTLTRLVLTNAIYFKANWLDPFDEAETRDGPFRLEGGGSVTVPMMNQVLTTSYCAAAGEYQAVKLAYQGTKKNSMIVILPAAGGLAAFENSLDTAKLAEILQSLGRYRVTLAMPKISYEWEDSLKGTLQSLGMTDAFIDSSADFSGINGERDLFIHDVLHKAFVTVDEKGTEAAAATAIIMGITSIPPSVVMTIDRPFLFLIYNDDTGAVLFLGRVMQP